MVLTDILEVVRSLNGGSVIPTIDDEVSFCDLGSDFVKLYLGNGRKYYYFTEYVQENELDNMSAIEQVILYNDKDKHIVKPEPQYAYLVLFYKVNEIDERVHKKVIELEENEYFYKKYVFYYTQEEFKSFKSWYKEQTDKTVNNLINSSVVADNMSSDYVQFLLRLLVKIPFLRFDFKKVELKDFNDRLDTIISRMRNCEIISTLNKDISILLGSNNYDINKAVDLFYKEKVGE